MTVLHYCTHRRGVAVRDEDDVPGAVVLAAHQTGAERDAIRQRLRGILNDHMQADRCTEELATLALANLDALAESAVGDAAE